MYTYIYKNTYIYLYIYSSSSSSRGSSLNSDVDNETLQGLIHSCISKCDVDVRRELLSNVVLVGGGSLIDGLSYRMQHELNEILPANMKVKKLFHHHYKDVYIYVYTYIYTYIYIYIYIYVYIYINMYIYMYIYMWFCLCTNRNKYS
jgi:hypothetical protein